MRRPCMSVKATTTVSMSPLVTLCASDSLVSKSLQPRRPAQLRAHCGAKLPRSASSGFDLGHAGRSVALRLRVAVLAQGERELFLGRQHQTVPADEGEVKDAYREVHQRANHSWPVSLVGVQRDQRDHGDDAGDARAPL